ncbi:hypothetical protein FF1_010085 [Malus domestica]
MAPVESAQALLTKAGLFFSHQPIFGKLVAFASLSPLGCLAHAQALFEETAGDDPFVFNIMIRVYSNSCFPVSAIHIYNHMREMGVGSDHFTFNFALKACARLGKFNDGTLKLFREMQVAEVEAAEVTVISILGACAETGALEIGRKIHESLKHHKIGGCLGVALVDTYWKCGKLSSAWEVFSELKMKPVGCWDSMIMGLAVHGYCNDQRGSGIV